MADNARPKYTDRSLKVTNGIIIVRRLRCFERCLMKEFE